MPTFKNISILIFTLLLILAQSQPEINATVTAEKPHQNSNEIHDSTVQPKVESNSSAAQNDSQSEAAKSKKVQEVKQDIESYEKKIEEIKQEAAKNDNLSYEYIQNKINEVIGSMSAEQKQQFQQNLSGQARAAYEHYKKSREQSARKQQEQLERLKKEVNITKQDQILNAEIKKFDKKSQEYLTKYKQFSQLLFQLPTDASQDFRFTLPSDQRIVIFIRNYINQDGTYGPISSTEDDKPIGLYVYQNRDKLVSQVSFYVKDLINFDGKANSSYLIRYVNHGKHKLISMHISSLILQSHIDDKLTVEDVADHRNRISQVKNQLLARMNQAGDKWLLQEHNQKKLIIGFQHYYFYNIAEIVVLGVLCVIQVQSIRKLLSNNNVI